jgi:AAA domain/RepB DNA-primase from phage plasmid
MAETNSKGVREFITIFVAQAHAATKHLREPGLLQMSRLHPDDTSEDGDAGDKIVPSRFSLEDPNIVERMIAQAIADSANGHNVYIEARTVRKGLTGRERGKVEDTIAVLALVTDNDADKGRGGTEVKLTSLIVETSPGNAHRWIFFEKALEPKVGQELGQRLRAAIGADDDTGVVTQPYRVAGTVNYPDKKKQRRGRTAHSDTRIIEFDPEALATREQFEQAYPERTGPTGNGEGGAPHLGGPNEADIPIDTMAVIRGNGPPIKKRGIALWNIVSVLKEMGYTVDGIVALIERFPNGPIYEKFQGRLRREVKRAFDKIKTPDPSDPISSAPLQFYRHGERAPLDDRVYLVQDLFPEVGSGLISGQWGTLKTFNALELTHCVMTGRPYLGQFEIRRPGGVLFFALEGASEIAVRLDGVLKHKGNELLDPAPFYWITNCPPLKDPKTADIIIETAKIVATEFKQRFDLPLSLIAIDTIITGAGYERDGQDNDAAVANVIMNTMAKVGHAVDCFVLGIDHYGKDTAVGTRGSSVKEGNADVILACQADRSESGTVSNLRLAIRKRRSGENGVEFPYRSRVVPIGVNTFGKEETTLVLHFGEDPNAPPRAAKDDDWGKAKSTQHLRKVVMSLMAEHGEDIHPFPDAKPIRALKVELVETEFCRSYPVTDIGDGKRPQNTKRAAFKRALEDAVIKKGVITTREIHGVQWVWLSRREDPELDLSHTEGA